MTISPFIRRPALALCLLLGAASVSAQPVRQTWLMLHSYSQESMLVTDLAEQGRLLKAGWKTNGTGNFLMDASPDAVGVHRLVHSSSQGNDRVFTIRPREIANFLKLGYNDEGTLGYAAATQLKPDMIPVYCFSKEDKHLWLISQSDKPWAEKAGWKSEGIGFWIWPLADR